MNNFPNAKNLVGSVKGIAFDLDGTIYFGDTLASDALHVISKLNELGKKVFYFTNNSSKSRAEVVGKLVRLGICVDSRNVYTSSYAAGIYCSSRYKQVYCIGTDGLKTELESHGVLISNDTVCAQAVVVGLDTLFTYDKLAGGLDALRSGGAFIVCNRDSTFPVEGGRLRPGCGPLVAALCDGSKRDPDFMAGKPSTYMLELLMADNNLNSSEIAIVGDSYSSDIAMAKKSGSPSVLFNTSGVLIPQDTMGITSLSELV
jgi:4-nitrophenyl phosphatase